MSELSPKDFVRSMYRERLPYARRTWFRMWRVFRLSRAGVEVRLSDLRWTEPRAWENALERVTKR